MMSASFPAARLHHSDRRLPNHMLQAHQEYDRVLPVQDRELANWIPRESCTAPDRTPRRAVRNEETDSPPARLSFAIPGRFRAIGIAPAHPLSPGGSRRFSCSFADRTVL